MVKVFREEGPSYNPRHTRNGPLSLRVCRFRKPACLGIPYWERVCIYETTKLACVRDSCGTTLFSLAPSFGSRRPTMPSAQGLSRRFYPRMLGYCPIIETKNRTTWSFRIRTNEYNIIDRTYHVQYKLQPKCLRIPFFSNHHPNDP